MQLSNHRTDANGNKPKAIPASIHSNKLVTTSTNMRNSLMKQINNTIITDIDVIKIRLKRLLDTKLKLDTLARKAFNQELNNN